MRIIFCNFKTRKFARFPTAMGGPIIKNSEKNVGLAPSFTPKSISDDLNYSSKLWRSSSALTLPNNKLFRIEKNPENSSIQ